MAIFNSYVSLPEGTLSVDRSHIDFPSSLRCLPRYQVFYPETQRDPSFLGEASVFSMESYTVDIWSFTAIAGWFIMEKKNNLKWMIWGYPHFRKPPFVDCIGKAVLCPQKNRPVTAIDSLALDHNWMSCKQWPHCVFPRVFSLDPFSILQTKSVEIFIHQNFDSWDFHFF